MAGDETMAGDLTMCFIVDANEGGTRRYHGQRWWREVKVRPGEGVAVMAGGVDECGHGGEEEDKEKERQR